MFTMLMDYFQDQFQYNLRFLLRSAFNVHNSENLYIAEAAYNTETGLTISFLFSNCFHFSVFS
ncbi:hypothetical protein IQ13_0948 [Lacibacter cauensis]|uniref:Uncharacterized protein n=1 Tax=Lacibacter cauensis TaxID=510947 RepID=A0A562SWX0_9BACT|nr:hypothetical protein IQ13_0948 [Lacibacter cauensis]